MAHDIGNPPFGHAGESAIQHWIRGPQIDDKFLSGKGLDAVRRADFQSFEGNAQGFRLLTKTESPEQHGGMQLTAAVLGSFAKYPRLSVAAPQAVTGASGKNSVLLRQTFRISREIAQELGLIQKAENARYRHPLAFLMEAADDICYRVMDVEDGLRAGYLSFGKSSHCSNQCCQRWIWPGLRQFHWRRKIEFFRAKAINVAIEVVAVFGEGGRHPLWGFDDDLMNHITHAEEYKAFKSLAKRKVYSAAPVVEIEACGFKVIGVINRVYSFCFIVC